MKQKLLLCAALFFGVLAFILTRQQIKLERDRALGAAMDVYLIRAKRPLTVGDKIKGGTNGNVEIIKEKRFKTVRSLEIESKDMENVEGREVIMTVEKGETLKWIHLKPVGMKGQGLAGIIHEGMRAISISVDATSSVTGLIRPNDHVDIIGTFRFPEMKGDRSLDTITMTILQNVIVLATGTQMSETESPMAYVSDSQRTNKKGYNTVSLSLTPKEVEMIIFASQKGRLHLSLRNYEETKVESNLQSVNFKFLEENIQKYNIERERLMK